MQTTTGRDAPAGLGCAETLPFERRRSPRHAWRGAAVADLGRGGATRILAGVELVDSSVGGIGFLSPKPVELGREVRLYVDATPFPAMTGVVARCTETRTPDGVVYRVGLDTGRAMAA